MKTVLLAFTALILTSMAMGQNGIELPAPVKTGGMPLMEALSKRATDRLMDPARSLDEQQLSNLLWAAWGYNRADKRTAPSSRDKQEIELYVAMKDGLYRYDAAGHRLCLVSEKDLRPLTGTQPFVADAPINIIYVCRKQLITGKTPDELIAATYANTGFIAQNVYLFCASESLATVVRAMVDRDKLAAAMALPDDSMITLVQTVGYPAAK